MVKSLVFVVALARGGCDQAPATPSGGSGSDVRVAAAGSGSATQLGQTTLSPEARSELDKLTGAPPNAPVTEAPVKKASAKPARTKPTLSPKPAKERAHFDNRGPERGAELMNIPDFESGKERWDYGSIRKEGGMTYYGSVYFAVRCDDRDGCDKTSSYWTPVGWHLVG